MDLEIGVGGVGIVSCRVGRVRLKESVVGRGGGSDYRDSKNIVIFLNVRIVGESGGSIY